MTQKIFVTGTDTDAGKTIVSAALISGLMQIGKDVCYWKPIQAGFPTDRDSLVQFVGSQARIHPSVHTWQKAASPDQAALAEDQDGTPMQALSKAFETIPTQTCIVEGAGGLFVPFNQQAQTWMDFLACHPLPCILVARTGLGTLNHISLSLEALYHRNHQVQAVVLSGHKHPDNEASLKRMHPNTRFVHFPFLEDLSDRDNFEKQANQLITDLKPIFD